LYQENIGEGYTWDAELYEEIAGRQYDARLHSAPELPNAYHLFVNAVRDNTDFLVRPEEGVTVMKLLDAIYESSRTGAPVKL